MRDTISVTKEASNAIKERNFAEALRILSIGLEDTPDHREMLYLAAVSSRYLSHYEQAQDFIKRLLTHYPDMGRAHQELAHLYRDIGQPEQAMAQYRQACELNPGLISSWQGLNNYYANRGMTTACNHTKEHIDRLLALPQTLLHITQIMHEGRLPEAESLCRKFLQSNPNNTYAMALLADIASRLGYLADAEFLLESAVEFEPDNPELRKDYMVMLRKRQKFAQTMEQAEILCASYPENLSYQAQKAIELMQNGDYEQAIALFDNVLEKAPKDPNTLTSKGHALKTHGDNQAAVASYKEAYKAKPDHAEAFFSLANLKTYTFEPQEIDMMKSQLQRLDLSLANRVYFHFALAQACEAVGDYEAAFDHLQNGNKIKRDQSRYTIDQMSAEMQAQIDTCTHRFFEACGPGGSDRPDPIFIVGLPRAGSTLIEQILASHSQIDGTLELPNIMSLAQSLRGQERLTGASRYPAILEELTPEQRTEMGDAYLSETQMHRGNAPYFTDKMPNNFRHIGLIHHILPNAKIIDARRYPLDCCFSVYKQLFAQGQEFSYGLEQIGRYYRDYVGLMTHWDTVLPGKVLRVTHEDVIDDLETQVRRILDFLNLPFEDACVSFHKTRRSVRTASSEQVRQPINADGVGRWKHYAAHLKPLVEAIDPHLLSPDDVALISSESLT